MSALIPAHFVSSFSQLVQLKLQQGGSRLRNAVMTGAHVGKQASPVDQFGALTATKVVGRFNPMGRTDAQPDRRWIFPQDYHLNQMLDTFDELRLITEVKGAYATNAVHALGRSMDEEVLSGIFGTNKTGETGEDSVSFPSSQAVSVLQGAASATNLTVAKLKAAVKLLMAADVDLNAERVYAAINAANHDSLLDEITVTSSDFNGGQPVLRDGKITRFMGIDFIHTELLSTGTDDQAGTSTQVPIWVGSGVYLGLWNDITTKISERDDLESIPFQVYVKGTFGATRLEEKKVVKVWTR